MFLILKSSEHEMAIIALMKQRISSLKVSDGLSNLIQASSNSFANMNLMEWCSIKHFFLSCQTQLLHNNGITVYCIWSCRCRPFYANFLVRSSKLSEKCRCALWHETLVFSSPTSVQHYCWLYLFIYLFFNPIGALPIMLFCSRWRKPLLR